MKRLLLTLLLITPLTLFAAQEGALEAGLVNPGHVERPHWFKNSFLDLREDVAEAREANKRLVLYFYQDGCPYCEKLVNTNFTQRDIVEQTRQHFEVVAINLWGDTTVTDLAGNEVTEKVFSVGLKVQYTPTLLFLDEAGEVALRVNGYYPPHKFRAALDYVAQRQEKRMRFADYLAARNPQPASGKLHIGKTYLQPPYDLRRTHGDKPLLVLFEQHDCPACDELHGEALRRPKSGVLLQQFDVVLLDIGSKEPLTTPDGRRLASAEWARELAIQYTPSLLFIDENGREVFRSEAYLRPFHLLSVLSYVASGSYKSQPEFQRHLQERTERMREQGIEVELWE
ncbi:MAG: thioredoxin fold domain-containing protein [Gammaproteobacteria bacterium]|nr:thioredoxin fold domain-containing protein [Gammaproteobacteria bacterium]